MDLVSPLLEPEGAEEEAGGGWELPLAVALEPKLSSLRWDSKSLERCLRVASFWPVTLFRSCSTVSMSA